MSIGVNIRLPFEQGANPFIAQDPKLVEMRYFFTRKLMLIKESDGFVVLPGGFGTLDEAFELLTLLQTGKADPAPMVLLDMPGGTYWQGWHRFLDERGRRRGAASPPTTGPVHDHRRRRRGRRGAPRLLPQLPLVPAGSATCWCCGCWSPRTRRSWPSSTDGSATSWPGQHPRHQAAFPRAVADNDHLDLPRLALRFDRMHYGRLRQLIDALNECTGVGRRGR